MIKEMFEEELIKSNKQIYLSAQDYARLSNKEKQELREILVDKKLDPDEYEKEMKKHWPKEFHPKPLTWRKR